MDKNLINRVVNVGAPVAAALLLLFGIFAATSYLGEASITSTDQNGRNQTTVIKAYNFGTFAISGLLLLALYLLHRLTSSLDEMQEQFHEQLKNQYKISCIVQTFVDAAREAEAKGPPCGHRVHPPRRKGRSDHCSNGSASWARC